MRTKLILALLCAIGLCLLCGTVLADTEVDLIQDGGETNHSACLFNRYTANYMDYYCDYSGGASTDSFCTDFHSDMLMKISGIGVRVSTDHG